MCSTSELDFRVAHLSIRWTLLQPGSYFESVGVMPMQVRLTISTLMPVRTSILKYSRRTPVTWVVLFEPLQKKDMTVLKVSSEFENICAAYKKR